MHKKYNLYFLLVIFLVFGITLSIHQSFNRPDIIVSKEDSAKNINRDFLKLFSSGHKRIISSSLWVLTLLEADEEHYQKKDGNSWMYYRFMSIADMEPLFYENYLFGGMFLSIIKDDVSGAADLYERGLVYYPDDYRLNYNAGFNYYFEMGNFEKGLPKLEKILNHPKAPWTIKFLVNKLRFELTNEYDTTLSFLRYNHSITKDEYLKRKLTSDIYSLKAERDLKCLNENKPVCDRHDEEGKPYIYRNGKWMAQKEFTPYQIFKRK
jgi:tetratricopeptide (TPR) repeat protein